MGPFDRFNDRAKRVLALAQDEAIRFNHNYIGTEHLLLGLVREGEGVAADGVLAPSEDVAPGEPATAVAATGGARRRVVVLAVIAGACRDHERLRFRYRDHGGANERVLSMLREIRSPAAVEGWVDDRLAKKEVIWGFGHREYRVKDPRATILQEQNEDVFRKLGRTPLYDVAVRLEEHLAKHPRFGAAPTLRERKFPNVDFYSGIVYDKMGIDPDLFTPIFAVARVAGWLAHYLEQVETKGNKIYRPKQIYDGSRALAYVPLDQRA